MTDTLPPVIRGSAKSDRSICGSCKRAISKGSRRVGVQRWAPFRKRGSGYVSVRWHHPECIPVCGSLTAKSCQDIDREPTAKEVSSTIVQFSRAARLAVRKQVSDFGERTLREVKLPLACPYTGDLLERKTHENNRVLCSAHVHHYGPKDFKAIVHGFIESTRISLDLVSYVSGQFANAEMEQTFCTYHEEHSRLLLISCRANLSTVKLNPSLGPCDYCKSVRDLKWVFSKGICEDCRKKSSVKMQFPSQRLAGKMFSLKPFDLADLECQLMTNPKNSGFAPMKLYRMQDLESAAAKKHGSVEAAKRIVRRLEEIFQKRKAEQYQNARSFEMKLRSKKPRTFADDIGRGTFATSSQLRYLRALKLETPIGISKKQASNLIDTELQSKHSTNSASDDFHKDTVESGTTLGLEREEKRFKQYYATPFLAFVAEHDATSLFFSDDTNERQRALAIMWRSLSKWERREYQTQTRTPNIK